MLDRRPGRGSGAAVVSGDHDVVALALGHTSRHRTHADLRHQLDADTGLGRYVFQVMYQLRQIFDGVDVMVRRR